MPYLSGTPTRFVEQTGPWSFLRPATAHLCSDHKPRATVASGELRVGALLPPARLHQRFTIVNIAMVASNSITTDGRHQGGVCRDLRAAEKRKSVCHDLQAPGVMATNRVVQVSDEEVGGNPGAGFATNPGSGSFHGEAPTAEHPRPRTRCAVVAKDVEWTATPAGARSEGEREPEAKKENPKEL